jgi:putative SOS response-associated peptidase YedK
MCSNYEPINPGRSAWVESHFKCDLPPIPWRAEAYPLYPSPFIYMQDGQPKCELAQFGLVPFWAKDKPKFGLKTYNARSETVQEKPSYRTAWRGQRYGIVLVESFFEPNWEIGNAVRWRIKRADAQPTAIASLWERFVDKETGEIILSFSRLTVNADIDPIMNHFHRPAEEKRSVVVLTEEEYMPWLHATKDQAMGFMDLAPANYLVSEPAPKITIRT